MGETTTEQIPWLWPEWGNTIDVPSILARCEVPIVPIFSLYPVNLQSQITSIFIVLFLFLFLLFFSISGV